ncbi:MAG TPA: type II toxin-antitoxin system mRNA interferase toxin, RelE/StbE family [Patescibacteria group bacterium]|nr:type II toxin-antitoxin system mRNA interferase toxin, RelE/StbE family [Patescibacteria group bacterium]
MQIEYSRRFIKELRRAPRKIQVAFYQRLKIFIDNPNHPLLHLHELEGRLGGCFSLNITGDWRAIYERLENGQIVFFIMIGTHSRLYK